MSNEDYLKDVIECPCCYERWCTKCEEHWADCACPGPHMVVEHPSPELETAMNNVFAAFDTYLADANNSVLLDEMTQRIEELRRVGGLVITGEPE